MRSTARLVLAALLVLGLGWAIAPLTALPLYDGVGFPDEPYRFVSAPAGAPSTKPATVARATAAVHGGKIGSLIASSAETGPQITFQIPSRLLSVPAGTAHVTVTARPAKPLPTAHGRYLWSDVYDLTSAPTAQLHSGELQATITMRAATAQRPQPDIAYYADGQWHLLPTFAEGRDIYTAELSRFGAYAVIGSVPLDVAKLPGYKNGSGGASIGLIVGIGVLVVVVALFLLGRRRRARAAVAAETGDASDADIVEDVDTEESE